MNKSGGTGGTVKLKKLAYWLSKQRTLNALVSYIILCQALRSEQAGQKMTECILSLGSPFIGD